jgi:hypothetical protein
MVGCERGNAESTPEKSPRDKALSQARIKDSAAAANSRTGTSALNVDRKSLSPSRAIASRRALDSSSVANARTMRVKRLQVQYAGPGMPKLNDHESARLHRLVKATTSDRAKLAAQRQVQYSASSIRALVEAATGPTGPRDSSPESNGAKAEDPASE